MKWDQRLFNSLDMGGGGSSVTWVGLSDSLDGSGSYSNDHGVWVGPVRLPGVILRTYWRHCKEGRDLLLRVIYLADE
jgi:hypothetical protein